MVKNKVLPSGSSELRCLAEERLRSENIVAGPFLPNEESLRLIHELQVHQIELEMQNEELRLARDERDKMEALLGKYSALYKFAPVGYFNLDHGGIISAINFTGAGFLGVERSLLIGRRLDLFISDKTRPVFHDFLDKVFASETKETCEVVFLGESHSPLFVQVEALVSESREECHAVVIDITERKQVEESLRKSEGRHRLLAETMLQGVVHQDANGEIIEMNPASERILGKSREQFFGTSSVHEDHQTIRENGERFPGMEHPSMVALRTGLPVHGVIMGVFNQKFGDYRWISIDAVPVFLPGETHPSEVYTMFEDITERKQAEVRLKKLNEELENRVAERTAELREKDKVLIQQGRQAAMGEMIGNIAHQWRQPLNALGLTIQQLLLFYDIGEFNREFLGKGVSNSMELIRHMSRTIDDFRNYFRPDNEKAEFKVRETIANTLSLLEGSLQNPQIKVEILAKADPVIYGYPNEFAQVLINILLNARDALMERGTDDPRVTIIICSENGRTVVTVADNAGGIPEEIMDKIFDPYFTTKGPQHGTGVGLFMSKTIIEKNIGGMLAARNTGEGAEFRIEV